MRCSARCCASTGWRWSSPTRRARGRCSDEVTADSVYVRLHGRDELYAGGYTPDALDAWATRVSAWRDAGLDVVVYFDNDGKVHAPHDAIALAQRLAP
ncbi:DUF72 domain-containing protein [Pseudonocardia abyssalis]|uniref:DUF72 domain-containing protein n=1 Tax=Pseudonocardia abyssalis TaxID=2792008 RepID=UPI0035572399